MKPAAWHQVVAMFPVPCLTSADLWAPSMKVDFHLVLWPQAAGALSMIAAKVLEALVLSGQEVPSPSMRVWPPLQHISSLNPLWQKATSISGLMAISHWSSIPKVLYLSAAQSGTSVLMNNQLCKLPNTKNVWSSRPSTDHGLHLVVNGKFYTIIFQLLTVQLTCDESYQVSLNKDVHNWLQCKPDISMLAFLYLLSNAKVTYLVWHGY